MDRARAIALLIFLAAAIVPVLRTYLRNVRIRNDFDYAMQVVAKEAVRRAKTDYGVELDYSPDSIERLDAMLETIHQAYSKNPLSESELSLHTLQWGAYIGESLRKVHPGKWQRDSEKVGLGTMPFMYDSGEQAFPRSWVYKRIVDGPFDSVASKFYVFSHPDLLKGKEDEPEDQNPERKTQPQK
jgi:hypothetical protein